MPRPRFPFLFALAALALSGCGTEPTGPSDETLPPRDLQAEAARRLERAWTDLTPGLQGVSVAILTHDERLFTAAVGTSAPAVNAAPLGPQHRFRVASVTKAFTAALVLKLADEGRLGLDDTVAQHWPDTRVPNGGRVTIRQLLSHTAGVYDHLNDDAFWNRPDNTATRVWTVEELVDLAAARGPLFEPGSSYGYSNTGFCILGALVERRLGTSFAQAMRDHVLTPLGLTESFYDDFSGETRRIQDLAENTSSYRYHLSAACAAGAMVSTPRDVARFGRMVYGGRFLSPSSLAAMTRDLGGAVGGQAYGLGTRLWSRSGIPYHGHTGSLMNYRSILMYIPSRGVTVVLSAPGAHANWFTLVYDVFDFAVDAF